MCRLFIAIAAALMFTAIKPTLAEENPRSIVTAIEANYDKVFVAHDAERLTAFYANDATLIPAASPAITGSDAILRWWQAALKNNYTAHTIEVLSADPLSENTILATSHWSADLTDSDGKVTPYHGDAAQLFVKTDQGWKLRLVTWNVLK